MADSDAMRARRSRLHRQDDHSLCDSARCPALGGSRRLAAVPEGATVDVPAEVVELLEALDAELDVGDRTVRALAFRLAGLSGTSGPAAVQALRALGELVAVQRADGRPAPKVAPGAGSGRRKRS